jgi:hypothetical protein
VEIKKLQVGDCMKIKAELFQGKKGIVQERNKNRMQLLLPYLGIKISLGRS